MHPFSRPPVEPPPSLWSLPDPASAVSDGLVAVGADLEPGTLLGAYRSGLFPMPYGRRRVGWWSPDPRGVLPLERLQVSRSLRRSLRRFDVRFDTRFTEVMVACADPHRPHGWITPPFVNAYQQLHELGWAHSVECFDDAGHLVGGLYGVRIGALFAGESMFHRATDASKVALVHLVEAMQAHGMWLLDTQWSTPHLTSLGVIDVSRDHYLTLVRAATGSPGTPGPGSASAGLT